MGAEPLVPVFRFGLIRAKLLMPKSKACHHLPSEGQHSLQGDKHKKHFVRREQERNTVSVSIWYAEDMCVRYVCFWGLSPCGWCKTRKGDDVAGWKSLSLLKDFQTATASMARKRHFASSTRGFYGFCLPSRNGPSHKKARSGGADRKGIIFKTKADYRQNRDIATTPVTTHFYEKGIYIIMERESI